MSKRKKPAPPPLPCNAPPDPRSGFHAPRRAGLGDYVSPKPDPRPITPLSDESGNQTPPPPPPEPDP